VDRLYRDPMDYTLAELEYTRSKTCCWNSSTGNMYQIIRDYAEKEISDGEAMGQCVLPTVFMNRSDGYDVWASYAAATGRASQWRSWSEDEGCAQRDVAQDTERSHQWTDFCSLGSGGSGGGGCTDSFEPNNGASSARSVGNGTHAGLQICSGDTDYYLIPQGGVVKITFSHAAGDLDMEGFDASGASIGKSEGTTNSEQLTIPAGGKVKVYGYDGATGSYTLQVN
jgi:hypothetical protein